MHDRPNYLANSLLFAVIIALLLQPIAGIDVTSTEHSELTEEIVVSHSAQNEWTQSAGMATGGTGAVIWPSKMTVDSAGDVLVAGMVIGDAAFGSHASTSDLFVSGSPGQIAYIAKADGSTGSWQWLTETGEYNVDPNTGEGGGYSSITGIATHYTDIYVCGWFVGNVTFGNSQHRSTQDTKDIFVSKLNSNGQFQWTAVAGGLSEDDSCEDIAVDSSGNVFATGSFNGTANFNSNSVSTNGKMDIWIAEVMTGQVTVGGNRWAWVYSAGGPEEDYGSCIATDGNNVYGCGWFAGTATFGSQQTQAAGQLASYVVKLTTGGSHVDVASVGATGGIVQIMDMIVDSGTVYVTGHTIGNAQFGTQQVGGSGANDRIIFVAELGSNNQWSWATGSTSGAYQTARAIDMTGQGGLVIAGSFASVTSDGYIAQNGAASFGSTTLSSTYLGMVVAGIDTSGNWLWADVADGAYFDEGYGVAVMPSGSIVSMGDHCRGGAPNGQSCTVTLGTGSESTMGNVFSDPNSYGYAFNTGIHLWAIQADSDGDGVGNVDDNCPGVPNTDQSNIDFDNFGDVCDDDMDGDNKNNDIDNCDGPEALWDSMDISLDMDQDGCKDSTEDTDDDGDGINDVEDPCTGLSFKQQWSSNSANDHDHDGCHDQEEDADDDNDGILDTSGDDCLRGWYNWTSDSSSDHDTDGCADNGEDDDDDNDGVLDLEDLCPTGELDWISDTSNDRDGDGCRDNSEDTDDDSDGIMDSIDQCKDGEMGWTSAISSDLDGDGCRDLDEDLDDDNDGFLDSEDSCRMGMVGWISNSMTDLDSDGCHNDEDSDDDGDGFPDESDSCPLGETGWFSTIDNDKDRDGCRDSDEDLDDDNDSVLDGEDQCPETPLGESIDSKGCGWQTQQDSDGDGVWNQDDECKTTPGTLIRETFQDDYGYDVDPVGCWTGELDDDSDGYLLYQDSCPNTPLMYSGYTEITGCHMSEYDSDEDGINGDLIHPNGNDQCLDSSSLAIRSNHSSFDNLNSFGCWDGDADADSDGFRLYMDACPGTPADEEVLTEGPLMGCSASQRDEDADGVMTDKDVCLDTPSGDSVEKSGDYIGCSFDERVELGDTSAVIQKNLIWIILGVVVVLGLGAILTFTLLRKNRGVETTQQWVEDIPMESDYGMQMQPQVAMAPMAPIVQQAPASVSDYTQLPGGGGYVTGSQGETIYNAPDGSAWLMNADGSFTRMN
jgi:hypothetical protein